MDRRHAWASIDDEDLQRKIVEHMSAAPEWEKRLDALEDSFEQILARIDGALRAGKVLVSVIMLLGASLLGSSLWYISQRDGEISRLATAIYDLSTSVQVLKSTADYMQREQERQRNKLDGVR